MKTAFDSLPRPDRHASEGGIFGDLAEMAAQHSDPSVDMEDSEVDSLRFGAASYTDLSPWPRGGLNE